MHNIPSTLPTIERLFQRVATAEKSQQKDVRLSIQEARELANELASMTSKLGQTISEIHTMLSEMKDTSGVIDVKMDGGNF